MRSEWHKGIAPDSSLRAPQVNAGALGGTRRTDGEAERIGLVGRGAKTELARI
jgi:hypothetical protein